VIPGMRVRRIEKFFLSEIGSIRLNMNALDVWMRALRRLLVIGFFASFGVLAQPAHAQSVDWLLNIDDAVDPVPAGATID
jgi:hypothetical protein